MKVYVWFESTMKSTFCTRHLGSHPCQLNLAPIANAYHIVIASSHSIWSRTKPFEAVLCLQSCTLQLLYTAKMQPWALVTPASRGIGLELARRLLRTTDIPIVTSARKDLDQTREKVLSGLDGISEDRLHVLKVDVLGVLPSHHELATA
jgi:hypothetical protein